MDFASHLLPLPQDLGDESLLSTRAGFIAIVDQEFAEFEKQGGFASWTTAQHPDTSRKTCIAPNLDCPELHSFRDPSSSMPRGLLQVYLNNRLLASHEEEALGTDEPHPCPPAPLNGLLDVYLEDAAARASPMLAVPA